MRWLVVFHLWLSALLAFQPASVRMPGERGARACAGTEAGETPRAPMTEEEEVPGVRASAEPRLPGPLEQVRPPPEPVRREGKPSLGLAPLRGDAARGHWRAVLLAPLSPLEDDPAAAV